MIQLRPIGAYLTKFDEFKASPPVLESFSLTPAIAAEELQPVEPSIPEELLVEERERARSELREELEQEFENRLAKEREAFEKERESLAARFASEREAWSREEGARLGEEFHRNFEAFAASLRDTLAGLLTPFLTRHALEQSLADFVRLVASAASDQENAFVELRGPSDLLEVVSQKLAQENIPVRAIERESTDISARIDSTVLETRMEEWVQRLRNGE
jgi:hypothetical protein